MWLIVLSDQLPIVALVGRYPTNKLMGRKLISDQLTFPLSRIAQEIYPVLAPLPRCYPRV